MDTKNPNAGSSARDTAPNRQSLWKDQGRTGGKIIKLDEKALAKAIVAAVSPARPKSKCNYIHASREGILTSLSTSSTRGPSRRTIFRKWPRPLSKGKLGMRSSTAAPPSDPGPDEVIERGITEQNTLAGKMAGNRQEFWGESLFDFYRVHRFPEIPMLLSTTTGSKMHRWMAMRGEKVDLDVCKKEMEWARDVEADPRIVWPVDVRDTVGVWEGVVGWGEGQVKPFSSDTPAKLQQRLPLHRLPKKLLVHDPWGLLDADVDHLKHVREDWAKNPFAFEWPVESTTFVDPKPPQPTGSLTDIVHTYILKLSDAGQKKVKQELEDLRKKREAFRKVVEGFDKSIEATEGNRVKGYVDMKTVRAFIRDGGGVTGMLMNPFDVDPELKREESEQDLLKRKDALLGGGKKRTKTRAWIWARVGLPPWVSKSQAPSGPVVDATKGESSVGAEKSEATSKLDVANTEEPEEEAAHLYISPSAYLGMGNHSVVYSAELDAPRSLIFDQTLQEWRDPGSGVFPNIRDPWPEYIAKKEKEEEAKRGGKEKARWEERELGFPKTRKDMVGSYDEWIVCPECVRDKVGEIFVEEQKLNVREKGGEDVKGEERDGWYERFSEPGREAVGTLGSTELMLENVTDPKCTETGEPGITVYVLDPGKEAREWVEYRGPVRVVDTGVEWQRVSSPRCAHVELLRERRRLRASKIASRVKEEEGKGASANANGKGQNKTSIASEDVGVDPKSDDTVRLRLTAKLSRQYDEHLEREASNYQLFPPFFFERWSGYNVIEPLHDPVPCGAVAPNFYGFYGPEVKVEELGEGGGGEGDQMEKDKEKERYRSPILLLEDCGVQVRGVQLDLDDRQECASLFFRMHNEGWIHNSPFARNVLVQQEEVWDDEAVDSDLVQEVKDEVEVEDRFAPSDSKGEDHGKGKQREVEGRGEIKKTVIKMVKKRIRRTFRLIDFGRTSKLDAVGRERNYRMSEERVVSEVFQVGTYEKGGGQGAGRVGVCGVLNTFGLESELPF